MAYTFEINAHALKRHFSVYVVVAQSDEQTLLYIGKTGDNREGCNPLISRCGNHFSYNGVHSQVRNKIPAHEQWKYTYVFDHFDEYCKQLDERRSRIDRINEMERWLNTMLQEVVAGYVHVKVLNPYLGRGRYEESERSKRRSYRTAEAKAKLESVEQEVKAILAIPSANKRSRLVRQRAAHH
jgi:hypothetical protein